MTIQDAPVGASFKVIRVMTGREVGKRLADMGFTEGAEGEVVRGGFLRGPFQIRILGYDVLVRRSEAAEIEVAPVGDWSALSDALGFGRGHRGGMRGRFGRRHHGGWRGGESE